MSTVTQPQPDDVCELFVDEAGGPDIFAADGTSKIGSNGVSHYFLLGMLEVDDPPKLAAALTALREDMKRDPYFAGVESFKPERKKTALWLHAKDDLPDVRVKVFDLLRSFGKALSFRAVVCDKEAIRQREIVRREEKPGHRYNPDHLYDELTHALLGKFTRMAGGYKLWVAKRGSKDRNAALRTALQQAEADFEAGFGFSRGGVEAWIVTVTNPAQTVCLQATDYFLWALQRFYEPRIHQETGQTVHEDRYLNALLPQIVQIHDLHFGPQRGTFFTPRNPLSAGARFEPKRRKRKMP